MGVREEGTNRIKKRQSHLSRVKVHFIVGGNGLISKQQRSYVMRLRMGKVICRSRRRK
ncbi:hypothetical protein STEG23_034362, partial [Scotinomys teguina]